MVEYKKLKKLKKTSLRIRKDGRIELRFYKNNKCHSIYGWTQEEVLEKYNNWKPTKLKINKNKKNNLKFIEWYNEWLSVFKKPNCAQSTIKSIVYGFRKYLLPILGEQELKSITTLQIQTILNNIEYLRTKTILFNNLNNCFKRACVLKKITKNPCDMVEIKRVNTINQGVALTRMDEQKLIEYLFNVNHKMKNLFIFYLYTGMRRSEALRLNKNDIDYENKQIMIKGTKTKNAKRTIPVNESILALIPNNDIPFNFTPDAVSREFASICKILKFNSNVKLHSLRHTFATRCIESGVDIKLIQKWLGHSTIKITGDIYTHVQSDWELENFNKITHKLPIKITKIKNNKNL